MSKSKWIITSVLLVGVVVVVGVVIYANYKNEIADTNSTTLSGNTLTTQFNSLRIAKDIDEYTKQASAIVIGTFVSKGEGEWNKDKTRIYTNLFFKVDEVLKGDIKSGQEIVIKQYGGEVDGQTDLNDSVINYVDDKSNLLFLGTNEDGEYVVFAGDWGQFIVNEDNTVKNFSDETVSLSDFKSEISKRVE